ncbi:MAG: hypothetical protein ABSC25_19195 [Roseiarcus sp.]
MRRLLSLLAVTFAAPAAADTIDCAAMKSTTRAFELAVDSTNISAGKDPYALHMRRQVNRKADETVVYDIFPSQKFLRRTFNANGFFKQFLGVGDTAPSVASYSIDTTKDYFGLGKPFEYNIVMKTADGKVVSDTNTSVTFDSDVDVELGGCSYRLTRIVESSHGGVNGKTQDNRVELWYSRDLKTSLYSRLENSNGTILELRARDISTSFTPVE